jgi:hypothetical protein
MPTIQAELGMSLTEWRRIRRREDQIFVKVVSDRIPDIALVVTVQRQGQFIFGMAAPFKQNARQTPVVNPNRTVVAKLDAFVCWFHGGNRKVIVWIVSLLWA